MKSKNYFKTQTVNAILIMGTAFALTSCNTNPNKENPKDMAQEHNDAKFPESKQEKKDADFLVDAAEINLEEIQLGHLAQNKSTRADVKELGKMMETEHTKALADLTKLAAKKSITIPTSITNDGQKDVDNLNGKTGNDFDKKFCEKMVDGHKDAISKFEKASTDCNDADIKAWASATLPVLRMHLDHSLNCQKNVENQPK